MLPHDKELVKRLEDQPFDLIGINSDGSRDVLLNILEANDITWRQVVDGSTEGPLATRWNVNGWPTIYVLDAKGVIRAKGLRGPELEKAVEELLKEMEPAKK